MPMYTTRDGTQIYYRDWGQGRPVVFSHGWPLTGDAWEGQMMFLRAHGFRAIAHDRRGNGRSDQPDYGNDVDTWADDLAGLLVLKYLADPFDSLYHIAFRLVLAAVIFGLQLAESFNGSLSEAQS